MRGCRELRGKDRRAERTPQRKEPTLHKKLSNPPTTRTFGDGQRLGHVLAPHGDPRLGARLGDEVLLRDGDLLGEVIAALVDGWGQRCVEWGEEIKILRW